MRPGAGPFAEAALCSLLFKTSAGAHTVVATVPAANDEAMCTGTPSDSLSVSFESRLLFTVVYTAIWETFIRILLTTFGPSPFVKAPIPSSRPIRTNPFRAFGYRYRSAVGFTPSAHIRTKTTSVGFPISPASPPATPAHMIVDFDESFAPVRCCILLARASYNANLAVEYVVCRSIEADSPDHNDLMPSRTAKVYSALSIGCFEDKTCMQYFVRSSG